MPYSIPNPQTSNFAAWNGTSSPLGGVGSHAIPARDKNNYRDGEEINHVVLIWRGGISTGIHKFCNHCITLCISHYLKIFFKYQTWSGTPSMWKF